MGSTNWAQKPEQKQAPVPDSVILIQGQKITHAGTSEAVKIPEKAKRIDVPGRFILPGFIDCHILITHPFDRLESFANSDAAATLRALYLMNLYLKSGVTSVRDVGGNVPSLLALINAKKASYIDSIRLFACGNLITVTGGHGGGSKDSLTVNGPWEWRKAVRQMNKYGFEHIKLSPNYTPEEIGAAVDEAKKLGMRVTVHGAGVSDRVPTSMARIAVQAGAHCIEHLNEMDDDVLDLMARKGVYCVPTLNILRYLYKTSQVPKVLTENRHWTLAMHENLFRKALERKIIMGIGTDYLYDMKHYLAPYFEEMKYFVELGASPMEVLGMDTKNGAIILGKDHELGTFEAGKLADIQVIKGDPLKSFDVLGKPEIVIIDGQLHRF